MATEKITIKNFMEKVRNATGCNSCVYFEMITLNQYDFSVCRVDNFIIELYHHNSGLFNVACDRWATNANFCDSCEIDADEEIMVDMEIFE